MVNSKGLISKNIISKNTKHGVVAAIKTEARLFSNTIEGFNAEDSADDDEELSTIGVLIKDESLPDLTQNVIRNNLVGVEI